MPSHQLRPALKKIPVGDLENERPFAQMQGSGEAGHKKSFRAAEIGQSPGTAHTFSDFKTPTA